MRISAFIALPSLHARELQRDREAEIGNERERMRRIDRQRRQHRKDVAEEIVLQPGAFRLRQIRRRRPARCRPRRAPRAVRASAPAGRWRAATPPRRCARAARPASARPGSGRRCPARTWPFRPATRTMKNSSRLLAEIDRKRTRSSSGWLRVGGLLQHPAVEMQPGQLPVDEALRAAARSSAGSARRGVRHGRGRQRFPLSEQ